MSRSQESFHKKEVRKKKEKKRKEKAEKRQARKEGKSSLDDMIAYVDEFGNIVDEPPEEPEEEVKAEDIEVSVPPKEEREPELDQVRTGTVEFFNDQKGYGFIRDVETRESIFVHINNAFEEIAQGNKVTFEVEMGPKGPSAIQVKMYKPE